jgi:hypothetical protein
MLAREQNHSEPPIRRALCDKTPLMGGSLSQIILDAADENYFNKYFLKRKPPKAEGHTIDKYAS